MAAQTEQRRRFRKAQWHSYLIAVLGAPLLIGWLPQWLPGSWLPITTLGVVPIVISAYLGGLAPGLVAVAAGLICIVFADSHIGLESAAAASARAAALPADIAVWSLFLAIGVLLAWIVGAAQRARLRAEANELRSATTLANIDEAIIVTDKEGRIQYANPAATKLVQATERAVLDKPFDEVFRIVDAHTLTAGVPEPPPFELRQLTQNRADHYVLLCADGRQIPLEVSVAPVREHGRYNGRIVITLRDRSEQGRIESALHERHALQEQLAAFANMLPGALHTIRISPDGKSRLSYASPSFAETYGTDPAMFRDDATGMGDLIHPDDRRCITALEPVRSDQRIKHPKKGYVWVELHAVPMMEPDGSIVWNGIFFDISQRKAAEESLRQSQARLLGVVDASMDAIVTLDDRQGIVLFNPAAEHMFRCTENSMLGLTLENFVIGYMQTDSKLLLDMLRRDEIRDLRLGELSNLYGRRSDGEVFPLELSLSRTEIDGSSLLSMTLRDITERKRAAERLQSSQQQLRAALDAGSLGVITVYTHSGELEFDDKAIQQSGVMCAPQLRQPPSVLLNVVHPADRRHLMREYCRSVKYQTPFRIECRVVDANGNTRWLVFRGAVVIEEASRESKLTAVVIDATARKLGEEQRLRSQKLESLGVLAGGIAHDFNNLLLAITGNLKLALSDVGESHGAAASLREIDKAATRATDLVRRILAFSRPQDHKREAVALAPVIEEMLALARAVLPTSIAIRLFASEPSPLVLVDAIQVHQALINLLTNAADAVPTSGGEIEIHVDVVEADALAQDSNGQLQIGRRYARVSISDNGVGMDATTLRRIFDPFYTTKPLGQGTGLGLAIVHGIMKSHEGAVTVHSEVGRGTSFALYFPVHADTAPQLPQTDLRKDDARRGHILYVDDEEALVYLMTRTLQRMGHEVTGYSIPQEAFEAVIADPQRFDLIVTDMSMPGMTGLELARKILAMNRELPVIITTGFVRAEDYEAATAAGVMQLILKPNTIDELGVTIERVLQGQHRDAPIKSN